MALHVDIPTRSQIEALLTRRSTASVSIYIPTDPASSGEAERIELKNATSTAIEELRATGTGTAEVSAIEEALHDLVDDEEFWRFQARSLAVLATPADVVTFRLPNQLASLVVVSDRFHLKPLLRSVTFPQAAFVLALAQGSVRLLEIAPDLGAWEVDVADLPSDAASAAGKSSIGDRSPSGRLQGSEGQKVRIRQYARQVDQALRPLLMGLDLPLILAATEPIDAIFRSVNSYPHLVAQSIAVNPETTSNQDLAALARPVLDNLYADDLRALAELFELRTSQGRAASDISDVARAATLGAVDTVLVDMDEVVPGSIDEHTGAVDFSDDENAYGVVDEIARRVWLSGGRVLSVRRHEIPRGGSVAAILRYAVGAAAD